MKNAAGATTVATPGMPPSFDNRCAGIYPLAIDDNKPEEDVTVPINARDLALDTLLLMTVATLMLMGVVGSLFGLSEPHSLFAVALVPDAAIATSLASIGVLAILQGWRRMRWLSALALMALALYTLAHNALAPTTAPSWLTGQERMSSIGAMLLLSVVMALWCGQSTPRRRLFWLFCGLGQWLFGGLLLVRLWVGVELDHPMFSSSPVAWWCSHCCWEPPWWRPTCAVPPGRST